MKKPRDHIVFKSRESLLKYASALNLYKKARRIIEEIPEFQKEAAGEEGGAPPAGGGDPNAAAADAGLMPPPPGMAGDPAAAAAGGGGGGAPPAGGDPMAAMIGGAGGVDPMAALLGGMPPMGGMAPGDMDLMNSLLGGAPPAPETGGAGGEGKEPSPEQIKAITKALLENEDFIDKVARKIREEEEQQELRDEIRNLKASIEALSRSSGK